MAGDIELDVYQMNPGDTPPTFLATLDDAFDKIFTPNLFGAGSGQFSINRNSANATAAILAPGNLVKVRVPRVDADPIFAFFMETGDFTLISRDEQGGETLTFGGRGILSYLDFAVMWDQSYLTSPFVGSDPFDQKWRLNLAGTGNAPGQILWRVVREVQEAGRPQSEYPLLTMTFDLDVDSDGNAWATTAATATEFTADVGESVFSVMERLVATNAIIVNMDPDFNLNAYNAYGRDLTGAFGANTVRFERAVNITDKGLQRRIAESVVATHMLAIGEGDHYGHAALAGEASMVTKSKSLHSYGVNTSTLDAIAAGDAANRLARSEQIEIQNHVGNAPASGYYLPGPEGTTNGHAWVGDEVTVHTGNDETDYTEADFTVTTIVVTEDAGNGRLRTVYVLGGGAEAIPGGGGGEPPPPGPFQPCVPQEGQIGVYGTFAWSGDMGFVNPPGVWFGAEGSGMTEYGNRLPVAAGVIIAVIVGRDDGTDYTSQLTGNGWTVEDFVVLEQAPGSMYAVWRIANGTDDEFVLFDQDEVLRVAAIALSGAASTPVSGSLDTSGTSYPIGVTPAADGSTVFAGIGIPSSFTQCELSGDPLYTQLLVSDKATRPRVVLQYRNGLGASAQTAASQLCAPESLPYVGVIMAWEPGDAETGDDSGCVPASGQLFGIPPYIVIPTPSFGPAGTEFTIPYQFQDGSLKPYLDGNLQPNVTDYDGAAGTFTLGYDVLPGEQLRVEGIGR